MTIQRILFSAIIFFSLGWIYGSSVTKTYKHVIFMHGLFGDPTEFRFITRFINQTHPGTTYSLIDAYDHMESLLNLWNQTNHIKPMMADIMKQHPEGVHLLCFSQGGLVCRSVLESMKDHNVHNFISLSSPQGGQYGDTSYLRLFPKWVKKNIYKFFYSPLGQQVSIANYWNDPHHQSLYRNCSKFLAVLNNQSSTIHNQSEAFKSNFLKIKNLILIGGPQDDVITPWQSSQFAALDENETIVKMEKQEWYTKDSFGLKTLDQRGSIHQYTVPGYVHNAWVRSTEVFHKYIKPWLD